MVKIENRICLSIWGNLNFGWASLESDGRSGGILTLWNNDVFYKISSWYMRGLLVVNGLWKEDGTRVCVLNVYTPCIHSKKVILWDDIQSTVSQFSDHCICIVGDFNAVRMAGERAGKNDYLNSRDMKAFDQFIEQEHLFDMPFTGGKFTYYRKDGSCKSKLDRILVNEEWLDKWPHQKLKRLGRTFSDHCPIVLEHQLKDWGPSPFRLINGWLSHPNFMEFVKVKWRGYEISGWGGYILKE